MAIIDLFDRGWRINPQGDAYLQDDRRYSFDEIGELSCRIANGLLALGLPKETKGAVWAVNDVTAWACTLGLWRANMCWIPVGARNSADFNSNTRVVSVYATEPVYIKFGDSSVTAAATDHYFPAGVYYDFAIGGDRTGIIRALRCCA